MKVIEILLSQLVSARWNSNQMDDAMLSKLRENIRRYGIVENLVVRPNSNATYEVLSGNQRLKVLRETGFSHAPCVVVDLDDAHARLLSQALNSIRGEDDLGLRAEAVRKVLETINEQDVLAVLPETANTLKALASVGKGSIDGYLRNWQQVKAARLKHLQFQLTQSQLDTVQEALAKILPEAAHAQGHNPNLRGNALYLLCKSYLEGETNGH